MSSKSGSLTATANTTGAKDADTPVSGNAAREADGPELQQPQQQQQEEEGSKTDEKTPPQATDSASSETNQTVPQTPVSKFEMSKRTPMYV